jgi:predicted phage baseplate assembly protein
MNGLWARSPVLARDWRGHLARLRAGYLPEWGDGPAAAGEDAPDAAGAAFLAIVARQLGLLCGGLDAMPLRQQLEFLDRLGASLLPAQPARAALVFKLLDSATGDATVPAGTRVAAVLPPPAPALAGVAAAPAAPAPEFFTEQPITAMRGTLAALYSIDPQADVYADHSTQAPGTLALYSAMQPVPHRLYLGHATLLKLAGDAEIVLNLGFVTPGAAAARQRPLLLEWEYASENGWLPLTLVEDGTRRFTRDGRIVLAKTFGPDAMAQPVNGIDSCWIRGTVSSRVPAARIAADGAAPVAGGYAISVEHTRELLPGDEVTIDGVQRARVLRTSAGRVVLDAALARVFSGDYLALADALPPLRPDGADEAGALPRLDTLRARVGFARKGLPPDAALLDGFTLDISKDFHPFGTQPARFAAFYLACKDAFSRRSARFELEFSFVEPGTTDGGALLVAEYFNGTRWVALGPDQDFQDTSANFSVAAGKIAFDAPRDWAECELAGNRQHWLRLRLAAGDFGRPRELLIEPDPADSSKYIVSTVAATLAPPVIGTLAIGYVVFSNPEPLERCLTENDFAFADRSAQAHWHRGAFAPFTPVADRVPALHLGFSARPPAALLSLFVQVLTPAPEADPQPCAWDYWGARGWTELSVRDGTQGLQRSGLLQFVGAPDALPRPGLGGALYRIRARLKTGLGAAAHASVLGGVWLNAVSAAQGQHIQREQLGTSNGEPDQCYALPPVRAAAGRAELRSGAAGADTVEDAAAFEAALALPLNGVPIADGEQVEVREWSGRGEDWRTAVAGVPEDRLRFETDPQDAAVKTAVWVRWRAVPQLHASGPDDRHYLAERARGLFRFPGAGGFAPPAGAAIVVSCITGGGMGGNVEAGAVRELRSSVGFVESVRNPLAAGGGAETELLRAARERAPQQLRHRQRAVSREDIEWLAREASPEVARARAIPLAGPDGTGQRGFVGIVLVPHSLAAMPAPSAELGERVLAHLRRRVTAGLAGGLRLLPPCYLPIGVRAELVPASAEAAGSVEALLRARIVRYLHPLAGGRDGRGWDFGGTLPLSDLAALIVATPGVAALRRLQLAAGDALAGDHVALAPEQLPAAGELQLKVIVPSLPYALA